MWAVGAERRWRQPKRLVMSAMCIGSLVVVTQTIMRGKVIRQADEKGGPVHCDGECHRSPFLRQEAGG
ncbi:hypothetical protein Sfulv_53880 [Streptomyces fulvorobeus]|uniref:Uncharacterized protein n=1 Tax=Streptomyces fulvorobeus TaxID=284028 RepID=A0A7J0CEA5_9ACTN|nr:hypothetical protein Sfulv_53880 [Streptomyces fulvorobeus]